MEVNFDPGQDQEVEVRLDKKAAKKKSDRDKLADRAAYENLGLSVLKLKMSTYRVLKKQIEELGVKTIGHCSIIVAREKAEAVVAELDAIAKEWEESDIATDPMARISLQELKLDCNQDHDQLRRGPLEVRTSAVRPATSRHHPASV